MAVCVAESEGGGGLQVDSDDEDAGAGPQRARAVGAADGDADADPDALEDDVDLEEEAGDDDDVVEVDDEGADAENVPDNRGTVPGNAAGARRAGPSMRSDYRAWVKARKAAWRTHRAALKARGGGGGDVPAVLGGLGGGMQKQVEAIMHATWNIIQVCSECGACAWSSRLACTAPYG